MPYFSFHMTDNLVDQFQIGDTVRVYGTVNSTISLLSEHVYKGI